MVIISLTSLQPRYLARLAGFLSARTASTWRSAGPAPSGPVGAREALPRRRIGGRRLGGAAASRSSGDPLHAAGIDGSAVPGLPPGSAVLRAAAPAKRRSLGQVPAFEPGRAVEHPKYGPVGVSKSVQAHRQRAGMGQRDPLQRRAGAPRRAPPDAASDAGAWNEDVPAGWEQRGPQGRLRPALPEVEEAAAERGWEAVLPGRALAGAAHQRCSSTVRARGGARVPARDPALRPRWECRRRDPRDGRSHLRAGRGVVVVTEDGALGEGARGGGRAGQISFGSWSAGSERERLDYSSLPSPAS